MLSGSASADGLDEIASAFPIHSWCPTMPCGPSRPKLTVMTDENMRTRTYERADGAEIAMIVVAVKHRPMRQTEAPARWALLHEMGADGRRLVSPDVARKLEKAGYLTHLAHHALYLVPEADFDDGDLASLHDQGAVSSVHAIGFPCTESDVAAVRVAANGRKPSASG